MEWSRRRAEAAMENDGLSRELSSRGICSTRLLFRKGKGYRWAITKALLSPICAISVVFSRSDRAIASHFLICPDPAAPRSTFTATRTSTAPLLRSSADGRRSRSSTVHNSSSEPVPSTTPASNRYFQAVKHVEANGFVSYCNSETEVYRDCFV
ncbi:hypothetical protein PanWU01x14_164470 [Parasponia andersonii]|uniref:Uncharacterized protein n=1 Tax=Parasponia andersonii TaxID=3476 RepID=A0A2P5CCF7_PARAD|nr:hypothetical protein PanWU01x14_164470 [Parasponia andersonii]